MGMVGCNVCDGFEVCSEVGVVGLASDGCGGYWLGWGWYYWVDLSGCGTYWVDLG